MFLISTFTANLCALALQPNSAQALTVISDLDDTIKITRVNTLTAIATGTFGLDVFIGMDELIRAFQKESAKNRLTIVSGSSKYLTIPVYRLLIENEIRADQVFLVGEKGKEPDKKLEIILDLVKRTEDEFILIGDDQESDPDYYAEVQKKFPAKIKAIYIHQLRASALPPGQRGFYTAYEIALWESVEGRLGPHVPTELQNFIEAKLDLNPSKPKVTHRVSKRLIPLWQKCFPKVPDPVFSTVRALPGASRSYLNRVADIVSKNCEP